VDEKEGEKEMITKRKRLLKVIRFCPTSGSIQFAF
jgi:hypothetical protein